MKKILLSTLSIFLVTNTTFAAKLGEKVQNNSLIVYNGNIALVHEQRDLTLKKKDKEIIYEGVAQTIDTDSVNVNLPSSITLYSQQYRFDKLSMSKLLNAHIGKEVTIKVKKDIKNFVKIKATILSNNSTYSIVKTINGEILSIENKNIIFKTIPTQLITKPSLVWNISTRKALDSKMSIDYIIKNINWKSNYILNIKGNKAHLSGWVSIKNRSGKKFTNTKLYVLAGEINHPQQPRNIYRVTKSMMLDSSKKVSQQAYEGYHFYTIPFKVNIANNETTQIKYIDKKKIQIRRQYSTILSKPKYLHGEIKHSVIQYIHFAGIDFPLPRGIIRTYSKLKKTNILLGETSINHIPKNTPIDIKLGKNFDLKVTESIIKRDDTKLYTDETIRYTLNNSSKDTKTVKLLIPFNKNSTSTIETKNSYTFTKGNFVTFKIKIKAESSKSFKVRFRSKR